MASKAAAVRESDANDQNDGATDGPLMDSVTAAVKKLIAKGKERGYITIDELNAVMPPDDSASEQIEDVMTLFSEMGVNVVENEETEESSDVEIVAEAPKASVKKEDEQDYNQIKFSKPTDRQLTLDKQC